MVLNVSTAGAQREGRLVLRNISTDGFVSSDGSAAGGGKPSAASQEEGGGRFREIDAGACSSRKHRLMERRAERAVGVERGERFIPSLEKQQRFHEELQAGRRNISCCVTRSTRPEG